MCRRRAGQEWCSERDAEVDAGGEDRGESSAGYDGGAEGRSGEMVEEAVGEGWKEEGRIQESGRG